MPWRAPSSYGANVVSGSAAPVLSAHAAPAGRALHRLLQWAVPQRCTELHGRFSHRGPHFARGESASQAAHNLNILYFHSHFNKFHFV
jgi:hypothetical protein